MKGIAKRKLEGMWKKNSYIWSDQPWWIFVLHIDFYLQLSFWCLFFIFFTTNNWCLVPFVWLLNFCKWYRTSSIILVITIFIYTYIAFAYTLKYKRSNFCFQSLITENVDNYFYKCYICNIGFKRRGMLVNHLNLFHPAVSLDTIPELNVPIQKAYCDFYCLYCDKVRYRSGNNVQVDVIFSLYSNKADKWWEMSKHSNSLVFRFHVFGFFLFSISYESGNVEDQDLVIPLFRIIFIWQRIRESCELDYSNFKIVDSVLNVVLLRYRSNSVGT